jgi:hypothetical protein
LVPVAYASRALASSERNYAQIEKETLAIVFSTDHKPLQTIFLKSLTQESKNFF